MNTNKQLSEEVLSKVLGGETDSADEFVEYKCRTCGFVFPAPPGTTPICPFCTRPFTVELSKWNPEQPESDLFP